MLLEILEPGQEKRSPAVGIDLGTTNSLVAVYLEGRVVIIPENSSEKNNKIPSVVSYIGSEILVGNKAVKLQNDYPLQTITSAKRLMGQGIREAQEFAKHTAVKISGSEEVAYFNVNNRQLTAVEVSAEILKTLKKQAEDYLAKNDTGEHQNVQIFDAVVTVPAYFNDAQRQATKDAARLAGLNVLRLINEPTAAALAYGLGDNPDRLNSQKSNSEKSKTYMVYDLGGGTFDVSILKHSQGVFRVLATGGDTYLGGDDIDNAIANKLKISPQEARKIKEQLSDNSKAKIINKIAQPFIEKTIKIAQRTLQDAEITGENLDGIVLVGGSTRMKLLRKMVADAFGKTPETGINPDEAVVCGAALQAQKLTSNDKNDMLLLDVTPLSLGLETVGGLVEKVIYRNTPIPITRAQEFTTFKDNQTGMDIHVLQGEREIVEDCRSLAKFRLKGIPPMPAGAARILIVFSIDVDGILTVRAVEQTTQKEQQIEVVPSYGLQEKQILEMLKNSMNNAKEDINQRQIREAKLELERVCDACQNALNSAEVNDIEKRKGYSQSIEAARCFLHIDDKTEITDAIEMLEQTFRELAEGQVNNALKDAIVGRRV